MPECGFKFEWRELLDSERNRHNYLFEHQTRRNVWSFWKTYWRDCRPRRFWREVNPANPVRIGRLLIFWLIANSAIVFTAVAPLTAAANRVARNRISMQAMFPPAPSGRGYQLQSSLVGKPATPFIISFAQFDVMAPPLFSKAGLLATWNQAHLRLSGALYLLIWPWLTLFSLLIFQSSMSRAKINTAHVLRAVVYGCDFSLLLGSVSLLFVLRFPEVAEPVGQSLLLFCPLVTLYRMTFAYKLYLRFDRPFLTILASQVIVALAAMIFGLAVNGFVDWD